jgi:hypothetical protein
VVDLKTTVCNYEYSFPQLIKYIRFIKFTVRDTIVKGIREHDCCSYSLVSIYDYRLVQTGAAAVTLKTALCSHIAFIHSLRVK